ncbi:MAG: tRNA pseudouridine(13) synthase TruD [Gammaproteobacteria bacterium]
MESPAQHSFRELPFAFGVPASRGTLRSRPEDFQVREMPVCEPEGSGEHVWLWVRKSNANTDWVARQLARHAGVPASQVSYAGLKDRNAVTEQWFSVHLPGGGEPDWAGFDCQGVTIVRHARHGRKLRRGALRGNRFTLRVRGVTGDRTVLEERLQQISARGVPNYFGPQRFGHGGANLDAAHALFAGTLGRVDRHRRGLYLSAARSWLFNQVLAARVRDGSWDRFVAGDVLQPDASHGWFVPEPDDTQLDERLMKLEIHPTGPLWGRGRPGLSGQALELETAVLQPWALFRAGLERAGMDQERRALRLRAGDLRWRHEGDDLCLEFALTRGAFATAVIRELVAEPADLD